MEGSKRATAVQLLQHPWFREQEAQAAGASSPMGSLMMQRLKQFGGMQRMKRLALKCLVRTLNNRSHCGHEARRPLARGVRKPNCTHGRTKKQNTGHTWLCDMTI